MALFLIDKLTSETSIAFLLTDAVSLFGNHNPIYVDKCEAFLLYRFLKNSHFASICLNLPSFQEFQFF